MQRGGDETIHGGRIRSILANGGWLMGVNWIESAVGATYFAVMARYLGPVLYGHWAYGIASYGLAMGLVGFGFDTLIVLRRGDASRKSAEFIGLTLILRLGLLGVGALGLAIYALVDEPDPVNTVVLLLLVPALIGRGIAIWARVCFLAYERVADYAHIVALLRGAEAACGTVYLVFGGGLLGVVVLHSLIWVGEAAFGLRRIRSRLTSYALRFDWRLTSEFLAQGAVLGTAAAGYTWLISGPIVLLRHTAVSTAQLGQFAIVSSLMMIVVTSIQAFFSATLPVLSRSAEQAVSGIANYGRLAALASIVTAVAGAIPGWFFGRSMTEYVLGAQYALAGSLLGPFLLIGGAVLTPTGYGQKLLLSGRRWPSALANIAAGLLLAAGFSPTVATWSVYGAVAVTASAWLVRAIILIGLGELHGAR